MYLLVRRMLTAEATEAGGLRYELLSELHALRSLKYPSCAMKRTWLWIRRWTN